METIAALLTLLVGCTVGILLILGAIFLALKRLADGVESQKLPTPTDSPKE